MQKNKYKKFIKLVCWFGLIVQRIAFVHTMTTNTEKTSNT